MKKEYFVVSYLNQDSLVSSGPSGIRTHDLSNANAVSYRTRRPAHDNKTSGFLSILIGLRKNNTIIIDRAFLNPDRK